MRGQVPQRVIAEEAGLVGPDTSVGGGFRLIDDTQRRVLRRVGVGGGERPRAGHGVNDRVAALQRGVGVGERVIGGRGLNHPRQQRGLRHGEVLGVDVEIRLRRGLYAVRTVAEFHEVEIPGQNLVLGEVFIQVRREFHFAEFPRGGVFVGGSAFVVGLGFDQHEVVLDVLLVQGGRALGDPAVSDVGYDRSSGSAQVNPVVVVEPSVFDGDYRFLHRL